MTRSTTDGLARVTIAAPQRRLDVAVPESLPVIELMPALLKSSGESLADDGQQHGGWVLRRSTGGLVDEERSLAAQQVLDGEVLHLVARQAEWPEMDYDDVVDAIAGSARKQSGSWHGVLTRQTGVAAATALLLAALGLVLLHGPSWLAPAIGALAVAGALLIGAIALARAVHDLGAATTLGVVGAPFALIGGASIRLDDLPLSGLTSSHLLIGFACLAGYALLAYYGIADRTQYPVAALTIGLLGLLGAGLSRLWGASPMAASAAVLTLSVILMPALPVLAMRLGKLPVPTLPTSTDDLLADPAQPPMRRVQATVKRSDELLTGMLLGSAVVQVACGIVLVGSGNATALILFAVCTLATLLRARLFSATRHRTPLLIAGLLGLAVIGLGWVLSDLEGRLVIALGAMVALAAVLIALGQYFQRHRPSPPMARWSDIFDVLLIIAVVPLMCLVVGLFGYFRGLFG